jgi:hypothetical protein
MSLINRVKVLVAVAPCISPLGESQADSYQVLPKSVLEHIRSPSVVVKNMNPPQLYDPSISPCDVFQVIVIVPYVRSNVDGEQSSPALRASEERLEVCRDATCNLFRACKRCYWRE